MSSQQRGSVPRECDATVLGMSLLIDLDLEEVATKSKVTRSRAIKEPWPVLCCNKNEFVRSSFST